MTHTPTPWKQYEKTPYEYAIHGGIGTIAESVIATVQFGLEADTSAQQRQSTRDNATFIVTACNAHEELVKALRAILDGNTMAGKAEWTHTDIIQAHYQIARKALTIIEKGA